MSVRLMTMVFSCNMPELKTDDGKTVPDTTAKFVLLALADNCNDEGEGSYPGVDRLCQKTNFSTATVCNALNALRHNGFTRLEGKSKYDTNNYTILAAKITEFQWLKSSDFSGYNPKALAAKTNPLVKPSVNPSENNNEELFSKAFQVYTNNIAALTAMSSESLHDMCNMYSPEWVIDAVKVAVERNARNLKYIGAVLKSWKEKGKDWKPGDDKQARPQYPVKPAVNNRPAPRSLD